jgi:Family of unknown function (DUF6744)
MTTLERIKTTLARDGGEHLGDIVYWTLAEARIDRSTLESIWNSAQLDSAHLPEPPTAEKALKAAVREAAVGQPDRLIRLGKEDEKEIVFDVVRERKHADGSITYQQETRVILYRQAESISSDVPGHDLAGVIAARFSELRSTHTSDDIRRAMMKVLDACAAVTLRDHGGIYWCPAPYAETIGRLQGAVEKIGSSRVYLLLVHANADATRTLADAAKIAIEDELAALRGEVEGFLAQLKMMRPQNVIQSTTHAPSKLPNAYAASVPVSGARHIHMASATVITLAMSVASHAVIRRTAKRNGSTIRGTSARRMDDHKLPVATNICSNMIRLLAG